MRTLLTFLQHVGRAAWREFRAVVRSPGVLLVLVGGVFLYGVLYNLLYAPERVEDAPVVVVDHSRSALSRRLTGMVDATSEVAVAWSTGNYAEARELLHRGRAVGVVVIPADFERRLRRGEESLFVSVASTTNFLNYEAVQSAVSGAMLSLDDELRGSMVVFLPADSRAMLTRPAAVEVVGEALYNPSHGYAQYLIPPVLVIILFQTLLLAVGMTDAPRRQTFGRTTTAAAEVLGRVVMWCVVYGVFAVWLLGMVTRLFELPHGGGAVALSTVVVPMLMATTCCGVVLSRLFSDSEVTPIAVAFFSVGLVFLSGISFPTELIPEPWHTLRLAIPATVATQAVVKIGSMGATIADCSTEIIALWIQCAVYYAVAVAVMKLSK